MTQKMLTAENRKSLPPIRSTENIEDPTVVVKYFQPWGKWTWYALEANAILADETEVPMSDPRAKDAPDVLFFGYVIGDYPEMGYWKLSDLTSIKGPWGLKIEREMYTSPFPLSQVQQ